MTKEEKELLLKDLCARLPYCGLICQTNKGKGTLISVERSFGEALVYVDFGYTQAEEFDLNGDDEVKPYLRPLSSMTDEEFPKYIETVEWKYIGHGDKASYDTLDTFDWFAEHHFDYRGLIEKGLALESLEGMYKTE